MAKHTDKNYWAEREAECNARRDAAKTKATCKKWAAAAMEARMMQRDKMGTTHDYDA